MMGTMMLPDRRPVPAARSSDARLQHLLGHLSSSGGHDSPRAAAAAPCWGRRGPTYLPSGELFEPWERPWTTRPELTGVFGMVSSSESLASFAGLRVLELGGNAFDAAVATGTCLWHTEPGNLTPGGEASIVYATLLACCHAVSAAWCLQRLPLRALRCRAAGTGQRKARAG